MHDKATDNVRHQWYRTVPDFLTHQKEIEKKAVEKSRPWDRDDDARFIAFAEQCKTLSAVAKEVKKPQSDPSLKKIYRHPITKDYWHMNVYFWPDGRVQFAHNKVAESTVTRG